MTIHKISNNEMELSRFIDKERPRAISFIMYNSPLTFEDAEEVFQDSALALFNNIKENKLEKLEVPLKIYLKKIYRNQMLKKIRDSKDLNTLPFDNTANGGQLGEKKRNILSEVEINNWKYNVPKIATLLPNDEEELEKKNKIIREIVRELPYPCETILWAYYESNMSMSEIADELNYKNANTVKAKKSQCMDKLKKKENELKNMLYGK